MSTTSIPAANTWKSLDARIERATGWSIEALWATGIHAHKALAEVVTAHQALSDAESRVTFYRTRLHRLTGGDLDVDETLFQRIGRTVDHLRDAAAQRDARAVELLRTLKPFEEGNHDRPPPAGADLLQADYAALVAIAPGGAVLRENLLTHRISVTAPGGTRVTWATFQRLEAQGLVSRDATRSLHAGQPIALTDAGRTCLTRTRQITPTARIAPTTPVGVQTVRPHRR
ncbi:hypothetical protein ABZ502_02515 [Streptomyces abikoensis]|uniref:hypothetical protein n=1 Tax=Streptomyces abikoensis TaxID=97398 RepID=UPI0033EC3D9E